MKAVKTGWTSISSAATKFHRADHYKSVLGTLKLQSANTCVPTTVGAMKTITGATKVKTGVGTVTTSQAIDKARNHPFVLVGGGIAGEGTNYNTHHAILILEIDDAGNACIVDLDDTVKGKSEDQIMRIEPIADLLDKFVPDKAKPADFEGNADEPLESIIEPNTDSGGMCVIM